MNIFPNYIPLDGREVFALDAVEINAMLSTMPSLILRSACIAMVEDIVDTHALAMVRRFANEKGVAIDDVEVRAYETVNGTERTRYSWPAMRSEPTEAIRAATTVQEAK